MKVNLLSFIILENIFFFFSCKNIILPFNKITIENFSGIKSIEDLISYNIYSNVSIGTPPQKVAHFIDQTDYSFQFKKKLITYGNNKFSPFLNQYESLSNFWFKEGQSSTFKQEEATGFCSDIYYFNTLNKDTIETSKMQYTVLETQIQDKYKCGVLGLNNPSKFDFKLNTKENFFIHELKVNELISEYTFTILYEENNSLLNYKNDINFGTIIIGESPHIFNPDKYKKEEQFTYQMDDWTIPSNKVKFNSPKGDYIQNDVEIQFNTISGLLRGTESYKLKVEEIFFSELIKKKLCRVERSVDNIYLSDYHVFSCENNKEMENYIKSFPTLYFELQNDIKFMFTYDELFKVYNERLYFMVIFRIESFTAFKPRWVMGEIFLRKYLATFNYETKEISFYKNQVEQANKNTSLISSNGIDSIKIIKIFTEIFIGIILFYGIFLLYKKYRKSKRIVSDDLEDRELIDKKN